MTTSAFYRWGQFVARRPRLVMWTSLATVLVGFALSPIFITKLLGVGYDTPHSDSDRAEQFIRDRTGVSERSLLVISSKTSNAPALQAALIRATLTLKKEHVVKGVLGPGRIGGGGISADQKVLSATVLLGGDVPARQKASHRLQKALEHGLPAGTRASLTGESPVLSDLIEVEDKDLAKAEMIGLPIALLVLLIALRSVVAAGLPLLTGLAGIGVGFGILGIFSLFTTFNSFVESLATMIGLGVGIDYSMLIVRRFREQRAAGDSPADAIATTLVTAGRTVTFSGAILCTSIVPLAVTRIPFFSDAAVGTIIVVG